MRAFVGLCTAFCAVLLIQTFGAQAQPVTPTDAASHAGKAFQMMERGLLKEAAGEFEQALAIDPNNDVVRLEYATCLFAQARDDEARKQFEIERQRLGDRPGVNYYLGRLDLRSNDFASAIKMLAPLESDPALANVSLYLGMAYTSAGQPARALECLERAARKNPRDPEVHYRLARVYSTAGRANDARVWPGMPGCVAHSAYRPSAPGLPAHFRPARLAPSDLVGRIVFPKRRILRCDRAAAAGRQA
jgi:predicted Zn-dependent protease